MGHGGESRLKKRGMGGEEIEKKRDGDVGRRDLQLCKYIFCKLLIFRSTPLFFSTFLPLPHKQKFNLVLRIHTYFDSHEYSLLVNENKNTYINPAFLIVTIPKIFLNE